jgi:ornithine carbamoyltransferase
MRHLLSLADLDGETIQLLARRALEYKRRARPPRPLLDRVVGIYFQRTSTRTRTAFTVAAARLGATTITYGPQDLQTNTGESLDDTARVLGGFLDALVVRTAEPVETLRTMAVHDMAVVNAMAREEHPTQALADLATMLEHFGTIDGLRVLYLGEGNNTATALATALSKVPGAQLTLLTPQGFGLPPECLARAQHAGAAIGATVVERHDPTGWENEVDVVYTTRWETTGTAKPTADWRRHFAPFRVSSSLVRAVATSRTVVMHDLPAVRGEDIDADVLDGPQSIAFTQAQNKLYGAMAVLDWCLAPSDDGEDAVHTGSIVENGAVGIPS